MAQKLCPFIGIAVHPVANHLGRYLMRLINAPTHHFLTNRTVFMAVLAAIAHPNVTAIGQLYPPRSLHMQEKNVGRIVEPGNLKAATVQHLLFFDVAA